MAGLALGQATRVGEQLGRYRIAEEIGAGGMGIVYRAYDEHLDRDVAVKVLRPGTLSDEAMRRRFHREARSLSKLNHPNIATVHDFDTHGSVDYLVMEYVPGKTLRDRICEGPLPEAEAVRLATQLAKALAAAHEKGIVHRDLKPDNVRLTLSGRPKILDFGLAKLMRPISDATTETNTISVIAGTPPYMSPEQLRGGASDERADLFSFGVLLHEMVTGRRPSAERACSPQSSVRGQLVSPSKINPRVSAQLEKVILKCLEPMPEDRYQSAKELALDLRRAAAASIAGQRTFVLRIRQMWTPKAVVAFLVAAVLLAFGGLLFHSRRVHALTESDTVLLAGFLNSTSDSLFDDALNQALTVELEQSPFLEIVPDSKVRDTMRLMGRSPSEALTPALGHDLCQRVGATALLSGSIVTLGTHYVIGLTAAECSTGNHIATEQVETANKEELLNALGRAASRLRSKLGESLASVQKFDTPLEQATTPSLEALKAYSKGRRTEYEKGTSAAIPFFKRAVELDPNFAVAYAGLGIAYSNLGEPGLANENFQRAYDLSSHVSEREKLRIAAYYHSWVTGDLLKGNDAYELWAQTYPRDGVPPGNLAVSNFYMGQYDRALAETLQHLRLDPDDAMGYGNLVVQYAALNRLEDAKRVYHEAMRRNLEESSLHANRYGVAFLEHDIPEMDRQVAWAVGKPGAEDILLSLASDTQAFSGRLSEARAYTLRAVESARRNDQKETAAGWQLNAALREAEFGNEIQARRLASSALALASSRDAQILAALVFARAGAVVDAQRLTTKLAKRFQRDTLIVGYWLPSIKAAIELRRKRPSNALELLQTATPYELGEPYPMFQVGGSLYPVYLRAQCYLALQKGANARTEFQRIIDHRGIVMNSPLGALAFLGLARAYALEGKKTDSRSAYEHFFELWRDADSDIPILSRAKAEYATLNQSTE